MKINGQVYKSIWLKPDDSSVVQIIDQTRLPHEFHVENLSSVAEVADAIKTMKVRGAILIGVTAAYGMYLAARNAPHHSDMDRILSEAAFILKSSRPTAINLAWAVDYLLQNTRLNDASESKSDILLRETKKLAAEEENHCRKIGEHGLKIIQSIAAAKGRHPVNVLTHCNAGWLACTDYGTATAPIYAAYDNGIPIHVWIDETRPWNQGARLTAWELGQHGVPHTVIADNTGGHLMQHGMVDLVLVGSDRTTRTGDVANKIGTYLKALAAADNHVPFYVALPSSTFDWSMGDGLHEIPIEERGADEVKYIAGLTQDDQVVRVLLTPAGSSAANYGFDVTPARLVTGLITERGICSACENEIVKLFPEHQGVTRRHY